MAQNNGSLDGGAGAVSSFQSGGGTQSVIVNTDAQGQASVRWTLGSRSGVGSNRVEASAAGYLGPVVFAATGTPGSAAKIVVDAGSSQTGAIGQVLPLPLVVVVTDAGNNRLPNVPVTFTVLEGGGMFGGQTTITQNTDSDGRALALLTLGPLEGIANHLVEATFPSNTGPTARFTATALRPGDPANTRISGVVLDNSNNPIPGVTIRLYQPYQGQANNVPVPAANPVQTSTQGQFLIQPAPVGKFKLFIDGGTAQRPGAWPTLEYDLVTVAGQNNTVGLPIYLLPLDGVNKLCVSETSGGTLTLPQWPGFSMTVAPGSARFPGGSLNGCVTVTPVHIDKVPMVPGFGQQPRFVVTIQPVGTTFNPPAAVTFPNVDGLKPREVTELYSFDHDLNTFVAIGTGTVSEDGTVLRSDPGLGILKAGWNCAGNPQATGSCEPLIVSLKPASQTKGVQETFTLTAKAKPSDGLTYSWKLLAASPQDDPDAFSGAFPSCPGLQTCVAQLTASRPAQAQVVMTAQARGPSESRTADVAAITPKIIKVWSDQFNISLISNFLPGGAGRDGKATFILAGAGAKFEGRVGADLTVAPNTPKIKARLKAAFRTPDGSLLGQSEPFQETGQQGNSVLGYIKVQVAGNPNFALPDGSMIPVLEGHIAIGLDDNDDGTLDPTEVRTTSEALGRFVLVSKGEWDDERTFLRAGARLASRVTPNASDFLSSFANGDAQVGPGATPGQTNVRALQLSGKRLFPPLTHQVGVRFASENDGPIPLYTFATDSRISSDILKTQTIQSLVTQVWTKNQSSVQAYFANPANPDKDFTWVLLDAGGDIEFADPGRLGPLVDQDLFAAIHFAQVPVSLTLTVKAKRTSSSAYEITGHTVTGQLSDLYDFDYNAPFPAPKAAEVQAGFGTLGPQNAPDAGNVRGYVINLGGATPAVLSP